MIPGGTSTGSKRPAAMFGAHPGPGRMRRAAGCRVWDADGREYLDTTMALGAVALGYGHPDVVEAITRAAGDGVVGPLPPLVEARLADKLLMWVPGAEGVRFLKTGAEAVAAAVRIARVYTGRDAVITCGYQGWLDWCQDAPGVPRAVRALRTAVAFNDVEGLDRAAAAAGDLAAIVVEPVVDAAPERPWLDALRRVAEARGAVLVVDELKTGIRFGPGGAAARYGARPHLVVLGKALGNGLPIAAVAGPRDLMEAAERTWISSTLATEYVSLAAAEAVLDACVRHKAPEAIRMASARFMDGLTRLAARHDHIVREVKGVPELCYLAFIDDEASAAVASAAAARGLIFKRSAYNFMSLAHEDGAVDAALERLDEALGAAGRADGDS